MKETGIRKILGSTVLQSVTLLSQELLKPVLVAVLIAWPLAWIALSRWLDNFSFSISLEWVTFIIGALLAFFIAFITISIQVLQAASLNPVDSLRSE